jgi:bifunctional DNase/RNase
MGLRRMKVNKLGIDLLTHDPVVILKDVDGKHQLPILIGPFEATAIALALEKQVVPRPLSHDLMKSIIESLDAQVEKVVIDDIKENTFFAKVILRAGGDPVEIDARPSDSIALALRTNSPIFVSEQIILAEALEDKSAEDQDATAFKNYIENLKPSDFRKDT